MLVIALPVKAEKCKPSLYIYYAKNWYFLKNKSKNTIYLLYMYYIFTIYVYTIILLTNKIPFILPKLIISAGIKGIIFIYITYYITM